MKNLIFTLCLLIVSIATANATTYVVNNIPNTEADFTTLQDAVDGASNGDVLLIQPSPDSYGNATINKQLHIIGRGYFLEPNPEISGSTWTSNVSSLTFEVGSEGSVIEGLNEVFNSIWQINTSDITLVRNHFYRVNINGPNDDTVPPISNFIINQNYIKDRIDINQKVDVVVVKNNHIGYVFAGQDAYNIYVKNNTLWSITPGENTTYSNNIQYGTANLTDAGVGTNAYNNNISAGDIPNVAGNIGNVDLSTVFVGYPSNPDGYNNDTKFQLIDDPSNPAKGAGENGEDCGMFGGSTPYVPSGIPARPSIEAIYAPAMIEDGTSINVNVRAKANQ